MHMLIIGYTTLNNIGDSTYIVTWKCYTKWLLNYDRKYLTFDKSFDNEIFVNKPWYI